MKELTLQTLWNLIVLQDEKIASLEKEVGELQEKLEEALKPKDEPVPKDKGKAKQPGVEPPVKETYIGYRNHAD